jgi:release factor glutamine methyltransferase
MQISKLLKKSSLATLDAELLLSYVLQKSKEWIFANYDYEPSKKELQDFCELEKKRMSGISVAVLIGVKEFFGLKFEVNADVLIPRPETEILVEEAIGLWTLHTSGHWKRTEDNRQLAGNMKQDGQKRKILDIGTGSGCIAIALKKYLPECEVYASDISPKALAVAKRNAEKHKTKIQFLESNLLRDISSEAKFDMIVANLPYVPCDSEEIEASVKEFEPGLALFGGADGLDLIRKLLVQISELAQMPRLVLLEFSGGEQVEVLSKFVQKLFPKAKVKFLRDLAGIERVLRI